MASKFVTFTREEFEAVLKQFCREKTDAGRQGIRLGVDKNPHEELVYNIATGRGKVYIKVYSSISPVTGRSREYASDAIRFVLMDGQSDKPCLEKQPHAKRINTWGKNVAKRLEELFHESNLLDFCYCGSPKKEMKNRTTGETFLGCVNWRGHQGNMTQDDRDARKVVSAPRNWNRGPYVGD